MLSSDCNKQHNNNKQIKQKIMSDIQKNLTGKEYFTFNHNVAYYGNVEIVKLTNIQTVSNLPNKWVMLG